VAACLRGLREPVNSGTGAVKRSLFLLAVSLLLGATAYGVLVGTKAASLRKLEHSCGPELVWLKTEFQLDDATFERVRRLHEAYKPVCAEYCRQIDERHERLARLLADSEGVNEETAALVDEANAIRATCQKEMLRHFFEVSRAMPAEQGRRYLVWMHEQTLTPSHESMLPRVGGAGSHERHHH